MTRRFGRTRDYVPVLKLSDTRYRISFDFVPDEENEEYGWWSVVNYFELPSIERMQTDVRNHTVERYEQEGLTPPDPETIDVSAYVIDGAPEFDSGEISDSEALRIIIGEE